MLDAKDIDSLAGGLRKQTEQFRAGEIAHSLATQLFIAAGNDATEDFRWRVIATMVGEIALREAGLPEPTMDAQTNGGAQRRRRWNWWS